ncbi:hypothetical protein [Corynebacterium sp. CCUG 51687]|uniref:hypothetical protein n=1 Tax=Corynebacterium sp. CCUG 51687 TaxID=2823897 RepID=UPI00210AF9CA|nr:hypothetical protein [Corynebacterium sp. CCUG 51687]MCQ4612268.1 hypothetical protein [Corynebacterium sp. CCUG 51687]
MDQILPIAPGPRATAEDIVLLRQIEGIRLALRLFDRQLEASAKAVAKGTPQQRAFDTSCQKFLDSLSSLRSGDRLDQIRRQVGKTEPEPTSPPNKVQETAQTSGDQPAEQPNGDSSATLTPYDRAQLLVDKEAVEARTKYENDRTVLLDKLKQIQDAERPVEEKPQILEGLNTIESWYSKTWKRLESGARGAEILREIEETTRKSKKRRGRSHRPRTRTSSPKVRIKRNSSAHEFLRAIRELDREAQRQARIAREHRDFETMLKAHPYKNNSVPHDRVYLTSGFRNPRAKT